MAFEDNQRESFRAPLVDRYEGTLHFGDAEIRVCMLDESATGFKLSTDDPRPLPKMHEARLEMDDGVRHNVEIRHVQREGDLRTLGVKRITTRLRGPAGSEPVDEKRPRPLFKAAVALLLLGVASAFALQAAPVRNKLAEYSPFRSAVRREPATKPGDASFQPPSVPKFDRDRPFEFQRYLQDDAADWLKLAATQRRLMRNLLDVCGGARENRLAPAERAFVDFAAQAAMLELLDDEQRLRLEKELDRPLSGSALLEDVIRRYSSGASPEELSRKFGAMLAVSPAIAKQLGVSEEAVAAIRKQIDESVQSALTSTPTAEEGVDADQLMLAFSVRMMRLEQDCRALLAAPPAKTAETKPAAANPTP
jgi:hypothetical protein